MILVACCPPGNISNVLTHRARGDVALSVSMTVVGNLLAIFLMPLNVAFWGGIHPTASENLREFDLDAVEHAGRRRDRDRRPLRAGHGDLRAVPDVRREGAPGRVQARRHRAAGVHRRRVAGNWSIFVDYIGIVLLAVFLHDALALALGYAIARAARLDSYSTRAMTFEVGIRNAGLGLLIVFAFFDGLGGMAIVAAWWGIWDIIAGLVVATWWSRHTPDREQVSV